MGEESAIGAWEPWGVDVVTDLGPVSTVCDDPPESMPMSRPVGFVLPA